MKLIRLLLLVAALFIAFHASSQQKDSIPEKNSAQKQRSSAAKNKADTGFSMEVIKKVKEAGSAEAQRSIVKFNEDRIETKQEELIEKIKLTTLAATNYVKVGLDTNGLNEEHAKFVNWYSLARDGIFVNKGTVQTFRNLEVSKKILKELLERISNRKEALDKYYKRLRYFRNTIDSLNSDTVLYSFSTDSATAVRYLRKIIVLSKEIGPADSVFKQALTNVSSLQTKVSITAAQLTSEIDQIELFQKQLWEKPFTREFENITGHVGFTRPFNEIIRFSYAKEKIVLAFYIRNNAGRILLVILFIGASWFFHRSLKQQLKEKNLLHEDQAGQLCLRYPLLSATLIVLSLLQFIFPEPAFIFNAIIWTVSGICLTVIFRGYISRYWMLSWLTLFFLFLLACIDNFILQASRAERWFMLVLSITGIITCFAILLKGHKKELKEKWIVIFIALVGVLEFASALTNFYGRYNLSKTLLTTGFFNVVIGILFLWVVRFINQSLSLASIVYETPDKKLFYINFKKLGTKVPGVFYILLLIGWGILIGRNFYSYKTISNPIDKFLFDERTLGDYSFTIFNLLIFFVIIIVSTLISRIVSFFASDDAGTAITKKSGIGSWLLLVRIAIISVGLLLAFAAAGIPMDRITIIISALGVGIGFGLQTLVNNLVGGLIISFEKPVNVGDIVEIGSKAGVMKSIGFRSSTIYTWDGADVVIPNGVLLNQDLVNWTLTNTNRRIEMSVGVAYGTDLEAAKELLKDLVAKDDRILSSPPPSVLVENFSSSSIELRLLFWVRDIRQWRMVKSDAMSAIDVAFKQNNITIPFPQQDIYIHSAPDETEENKNDNKTA